MSGNHQVLVLPILISQHSTIRRFNKIHLSFIHTPLVTYFTSNHFTYSKHHTSSIRLFMTNLHRHSFTTSVITKIHFFKYQPTTSSIRLSDAASSTLVTAWHVIAWLPSGMHGAVYRALFGCSFYVYFV